MERCNTACWRSAGDDRGGNLGPLAAVIRPPPVRGKRFDDRTQICRGQKAGNPFAFAGRVAVDRPAELDRDPRLAGSGAPDQGVNRNISLVVTVFSQRTPSSQF
jgi:hypothetical protein